MVQFDISPVGIEPFGYVRTKGKGINTVKHLSRGSSVSADAQEITGIQVIIE
jgi:hypothetical protein